MSVANKLVEWLDQKSEEWIDKQDGLGEIYAEAQVEAHVSKGVGNDVFLANVWKLIRQHGYQFIVDFGDVDGVDFVANRVLESCPTPDAADLAVCTCEEPEPYAGGRLCIKCDMPLAKPLI